MMAPPFNRPDEAPFLPPSNYREQGGPQPEPTASRWCTVRVEISVTYRSDLLDEAFVADVMRRASDMRDEVVRLSEPGAIVAKVAHSHHERSATIAGKGGKLLR